MPTLGTQNIATSYPQLLKTDGLGGIDGTLQTITDGDNTSSALQLSTAGVRSTGTLNAAGATTLSSSLAVTGAVTLSSTLGVTGAATLSSSLGVTGAATLSSSLGVTGAVTLSSSLGVTGAATFSSSISATTGTATIGTATISTATISSATIPRINGATTFATGFTSSTGTNTIGTIESTTINNTGLATVGTLEIGGLAGPKITNVSYGTFAFTSATVQTHAANDTTIGTFGLPCQLGDIVIASINSLGSTTGTGALISTSFFPIATDVVEYNIIGKGSTAGTIPAGTIFATALRFTA
jgi:hypothetical protein